MREKECKEPTDLVKRLLEFMKYKGLNDNRMTIIANLSNGQIGKAKHGKGDIGKKTQGKILNAFPELNKVWLLTGEGSMLKPERGASVETITQSGDNNTQVAGAVVNYAPPTTLDHALAEISAQRRLVEKCHEQIDRLISLLEAQQVTAQNTDKK